MAQEALDSFPQESCACMLLSVPGAGAALGPGWVSSPGPLSRERGLCSLLPAGGGLVEDLPRRHMQSLWSPQLRPLWSKMYSACFMQRLCGCLWSRPENKSCASSEGGSCSITNTARGTRTHRSASPPVLNDLVAFFYFELTLFQSLR